MTTLDDRVQLKFHEEFGELTEALKPLSIFRGGYQAGLIDGLQIKTQVEFDRATIQQQSDRDIGHRQGLAHAAFLASHCVLPVHASEAEIRDLIVTVIEAADVDDVPKQNGGIGIGIG